MQEIKQKYSEEISAWFNSAQTLLSRMPSSQYQYSVASTNIGQVSTVITMWCSDTTQSLQPWAKVKLVKGNKSPDCLLDPQLLVKHSAEVLHHISVPVLAVCGLWRVFTDCLMNEQGFTLFMADLCKLTYLLLTTHSTFSDQHLNTGTCLTIQ